MISKKLLLLSAGLGLSAQASLAQVPAEGGPPSSNAVGTAGGSPNDEQSTVPLPSTPTEASATPIGNERKTTNRAIEEIVVTSQRREQNLQDVPISVSAFSGAALDARGVNDTKGLGKVTPGLQFTSQLGYLFPYIRGIGSDAFVPAVDPAVVTYLDGVYLLSGQGVALNFGGIKRVEVLKGPQGTLFGRNAVGGAISVFTKQPGAQWEGSFLQEVSNYDGVRSKAYAGGPITSWLGVAADFVYGYERDQYSDLYYHVPPNRDFSGRATLTAKPLDGLEISATYLASNLFGPGSTVQKNIHPSPLARLLLIQPQKDNFTAEQDFNGDGGGTQQLLFSSIAYSAEPFDSKLILSNQRVHSARQKLDYDGSAEPLVSAVANQIDKANSAELQFTSNATSWEHKYFQWVLGGFYFEERGGYDPVTLAAGPMLLNDLRSGALGLPLASGGTLSVPVPADLVNLVGKIDALGLSTNGVQIPIRGFLGTRSISGFTQATFFLQDWLNLTLGARYQHEKRSLEDSSSNVAVPGTNQRIGLFTFPDQTAAVNNFSPKATLSLPFDNKLLYLSFGKAFKGGTYNTVNVDTASAYVKPEEVTSYEAGVKLEFPSAGLRFNSAIFYNKLKNLQALYVSVLTGGAVRLQNAAGARTRGVEADVLWTPLTNLDSGLVLTGNATYVDAIYTNFTDGEGYDPTTGISASNLVFTGNRIARTPKWTGSVGPVQTIDVGSSGEVELAVDATYNSGFFWNPQNTPFVKENPYTLIDARASYLYQPYNIRLTIFGSNLTDKLYHEAQFQTDFGDTATLAYPRQYGLRLGWMF